MKDRVMPSQMSLRSLYDAAHARLLFNLRYERYALRQRLRHITLAWKFLSGTMTPDDAEDMTLIAGDIAGWHTLTMITESDVRDHLLEVHDCADHPQLDALIHAACKKISGNWVDVSDAQSSAVSEAADLVLEYAEVDGVELHTPSDADIA